jgi:hypothetical protein
MSTRFKVVSSSGYVCGCLLTLAVATHADVARLPIGGSTTVRAAGQFGESVAAAVLDSETGASLTPRHFPYHTADDVRQMFEMGRDLGTVAVFIHPWSQANLLAVAESVTTVSRQHGLATILGLGVTTLDSMRGRLDLPSDLRSDGGPEPSFRDEAVRARFARDVLALASLRPDYLCLATEINMLAHSNLDGYLALAETYRAVYPHIKAISPATKVFVTFQWELMWAMDLMSPGRIAEHTKLIDVFRPGLDVIAFTSYPSGFFGIPADMPLDYYSRIGNHLRPGDEVLFMEIGWPTRGRGTIEEQVAFIGRLPELMTNVRPSVVAWSLLHDSGLVIAYDDLFSTGLVNADGALKPGYDAFKRLRR